MGNHEVKFCKNNQICHSIAGHVKLGNDNVKDIMVVCIITCDRSS